MKGVTFFGSEFAYLLILPLVYWCLDEKKGIDLGLTIIVSAWVNATLKVFLKQPRPFHLDPGVGIIREWGYGLPSGHAQMSLVLWVIIASWGKRRWFLGLGILLSLLIGFSRLYLGVHFHTDILAGWVLGALTLIVYFFSARPIEALLVRGGLRAQLIASAALALIMNTLHPEDITLGALTLGMGGGYALMVRHVGFSARDGFTGGKFRRALVLALRCTLGILGIVLIHTGLGNLLPQEASSYYKLAWFCRYLLLGFWIVCGAPWLFLRLKLAYPRESRPDMPASGEAAEPGSPTDPDSPADPGLPVDSASPTDSGLPADRKG
ncbi:MAG: phosphatase PAP2 family protein [Treponema sp.]|nr:phosphatase PAP2 family protein [Treponema sp.]